MRFDSSIGWLGRMVLDCLKPLAMKEISIEARNKKQVLKQETSVEARHELRHKNRCGCTIVAEKSISARTEHLDSVMLN
jgi:hypothetical protein